PSIARVGGLIVNAPHFWHEFRYGTWSWNRSDLVLTHYVREVATMVYVDKNDIFRFINRPSMPRLSLRQQQLYDGTGEIERLRDELNGYKVQGGLQFPGFPLSLAWEFRYLTQGVVGSG